MEAQRRGVILTKSGRPVGRPTGVRDRRGRGVPVDIERAVALRRRGYTLRAISGRLGVPLCTIRRHLAKALIKNRSDGGGAHQEPGATS